MAVYTDIDDETLATFLSQYDLGEPRAFKGIAEGVENSNFLLETATGRYILTIFEKRVNQADLPFFMNMMRHLSLKGFPAPLPVEARDGEALRTLKDKPAVIVSFLEGMSPRTPTSGQCRRMGAALARFHAALSDFGMQRPNNLSLSSWLDMFVAREDAVDKLVPGLHALISDDLKDLEANWPSDLPSGAIHADLFPDNVFYLEGDVSGVIDFYFACTDFLAYDIAVCLNAWCFEARGEFNITKGQAFLSGYQSERKLDPEERDAIPTLARGAAMRFFLTRLIDWADTPKDALVRPKNPLDYAERLGFHRRAKGIADYGG